MPEFYELVCVNDNPYLFACWRVGRDEIPEGMVKYDVRHDDECRGDWVEVAKNVMVNHWGTLIGFKDLPLIRGRLYDFDYNYLGESLTINDYIERFK